MPNLLMPMFPASNFIKNYKKMCTIINFDTYRIILRSFLLDLKRNPITKINKLCFQFLNLYGMLTA